MVAAPRRRDACRGASNPRNGRCPTSRLTLATVAATMSEYQYYEFQAIDRPLSGADQEALRALSTRARISATSFTNSYEWGAFKGDPARLMENWFELHLYLSNWGSRRLMIRWPARLINRHL